MELVNFNEIWNLLSTYKFEMVGDVDSTVLCSICKNVMIDPYFGICGCQYCEKCITSYIDRKQKHCPGDKLECKTDYLELNINLFKDVRISRRLADLMVVCPHALCLFQTNLKIMGEHIRLCEMSPGICPFESVGCIGGETRKNDVKEHMDIAILKHSELVVEVIHNLRNDVNILQKVGDERLIQINHLEEEITINKSNITNLLAENRNKDIIIGEMKEELCVARKEISILQEVVQENQNEMLKNMENKCDDNRKNITDMIEKYSQNVTKLQHQLTELFPVLKVDYIWILNDISKKDGRQYSDSFYKDNYNFRLSIKLANIFLSMYLHIIPGEKDNELEWPMKHNISLGLINQLFLKTSVSWTCNYTTYAYDKVVFEKQSDDKGDGIFLGFYPRDEMIEASGLVFSDTMLICCQINI